MRRLLKYGVIVLAVCWLFGCMVKVRPVPLIEIEPPIKIKLGH